MMIVIFLSLLVLVAIIFLYVPYGFMNESILVEDAANINSSRRIVRRDGVILFTDAGRGALIFVLQYALTLTLKLQVMLGMRQLNW